MKISDFTFRLREEYNSEKLLIELDGGNKCDELEKVIHALLSENNFTLKDTSDLWVNDEIVYLYVDNFGKMEFSRSIYDFFFILGTENQSGILLVDSLPEKDPRFRRR